MLLNCVHGWMILFMYCERAKTSLEIAISRFSTFNTTLKAPADWLNCGLCLLNHTNILLWAWSNYVERIWLFYLVMNWPYDLNSWCSSAQSMIKRKENGLFILLTGLLSAHPIFSTVCFVYWVTALPCSHTCVTVSFCPCRRFSAVSQLPPTHAPGTVQWPKARPPPGSDNEKKNNNSV